MKRKNSFALKLQLIVMCSMRVFSNKTQDEKKKKLNCFNDRIKSFWWSSIIIANNKICWWIYWGGALAAELRAHWVWAIILLYQHNYTSSFHERKEKWWKWEAKNKTNSNSSAPKNWYFNCCYMYIAIKPWYITEWEKRKKYMCGLRESRKESLESGELKSRLAFVHVSSLSVFLSRYFFVTRLIEPIIWFNYAFKKR
jgi:hypothetical protein